MEIFQVQCINLTLSLCNLSPQDTYSGGFTCPHLVNPSCIFGRTDLCTQLVSSELNALNDLRISFSPSGWNGSPSCNWNGVQCDDRNHVFYINLESFNLNNGSIPDTVGQLTYLEIFQSCK